MIKFGKKVSLRPLIISLAVALVFGLPFGSIFSKGIGLLVGILFFIIVFDGYYLFNLPGLFSYWEYDGKVIRFCDMTKYGSRVYMMLFPGMLSLREINVEQIDSVQLIGYDGQKESIQSMIPVSTAYGIFNARLSMIKNPLKIRIILKTKEIIDLDVSRDYTYNSKNTISELKDFISAIS